MGNKRKSLRKWLDFRLWIPEGCSRIPHCWNWGVVYSSTMKTVIEAQHYLRVSQNIKDCKFSQGTPASFQHGP